MKQRSHWLATLVLIAACGSDSSGAGDKNIALPGSSGGDGAVSGIDGSANGGGSPGGGTSNGGSPGGGSGATTGSGQGSDGGTNQPSAGVARFIVLGDGGTGDAAQKKVAAVIKDVCQKRGCEFALYLGDNIYETGATSVDDTQFKDKFEDPYADLDFPFYVVLGNHDYSGPVAGSGFDTKKADAQVEYTMHSNKWNMPSHYYTVRKGPVALFGLDTNAIVYDKMWTADQQAKWLDDEAKKSDASWKIAFGHHPYLSNGSHGNAGNYDGLGLIPSAVNPNGDTMKALVEGSVCGKIDVYFSGHDHDREWLEPACGSNFIVSGAAAKLRGFANRDKPASRFKDDQKLGFLWVEIHGDTLTGVFYDEDGKANYEDTIKKSK